MSIARPRRFAALLALSFVFGGAALAAPVTLDFDEFPTTGDSTFIGNSYVDSGFSVSTNAAGFFVWGNSSPGYLGSAALMAWGYGDSVPGMPAQISVQRSDGGLFNLESIDLANPLGHFPVVFSAYDAAGALLAGFTLEAAQITNQFTTVDFGGLFDGVARVSWFQGTSDAKLHEFDNLVLEALPPKTGMVPEPGSLALAGLSLGALALSRGRRGRRR
jgi:hypothetical protein